jgi:drug/metabolite transporter (DMT)-like permease
MFLFREPVFMDLPLEKYGILLLSGIIGIGISDSLLFAGLNRLGAGLAAVVNCSYSPFVILLSAVFLRERMTQIQITGVALIISGVLTISQKKEKLQIPRKDLLLGIALGISAMFTLAIGIILMKPILNEASVLSTSLVRCIGAALMLSIVFSFYPKRREILSELTSRKNLRPMIPASFFGGFLALLVWMGGMKYAMASEASALNQTNTIFVFVLATIFLKEPVTKGKIFALVLAVTGVLLVTL